MNTSKNVMLIRSTMMNDFIQISNLKQQPTTLLVFFFFSTVCCYENLNYMTPRVTIATHAELIQTQALIALCLHRPSETLTHHCWR